MKLFTVDISEVGVVGCHTTTVSAVGFKDAARVVLRDLFGKKKRVGEFEVVVVSHPELIENIYTVKLAKKGITFL